MSDSSKIEWTDASWNPVTGCTKVSPGCDHCYAETFAERWRGVPGHHFETGFDVTLRPERLEQPRAWKKPRRIFVNSMSDVFHEAVPDDFILSMFAIMAVTPQHRYQVLTKRHGRMRSLLSRPKFSQDIKDLLWQLDGGIAWRRHHWPLPNVWLGVSVEDQKRADLRIPALLDTPAAVRFISAEPLLGPVSLWHLIDAKGSGVGEPRVLDWIIAGGESGPGARPCDLNWLRALRDQCEWSGSAFFLKQLGKRLGREVGAGPKGGDWDAWPEDLRVREFPEGADEANMWHRIAMRGGRRAS